MFKKRSLLILGLGVILGVTSCSSDSGTDSDEPIDQGEKPNEPITFKVSLSDFEKTLMGEANTFEVEESISSTSVNTTDKDHKTDVVREEGVFLKDDVSFYEGSNHTAFKNNNTSREDKYIKVAQAKTYDLQKVFYLVTDYEKEELEIYHDSANRLPVVQTGDPSKDGIEYLLESSLSNQLCRQVSLNVAAFISGNLTNNMSLNGYKLPDIQVEAKDSKFYYNFEPFGYTYNEEDTEVHISTSFSAVLSEDNHLLEAKTAYETTEVSGEDSYKVTDTNEYTLTYGERKTFEEYKAQGKKLINPEDYFLTEVNSVTPFYYDNGKKVEVELNKLPVGKYIKFDAKDFLPSNSVDVEMKVAKIKENPDSAFELDNGVLYVKGMGKGTIELESATGVSFEVKVETIKPSIQKITIVDINSGFINLGKDLVKAYAGEKYKNIRLSVSPEGVDLSDIKVEVSHPELLEVKATNLGTESKSISYEYDFKDGSEGKDIIVTFSSISNPEVKVSKTYRVSKKLSIKEIKAKLIANSYKWTNIYGPVHFVLSFQDETNGTYTVYDEDMKVMSTCKFTYEITSDYKFSMTPVEGKFEYVFEFADSYVDKEGEFISLSDPEFVRDQIFEREEK